MSRIQATFARLAAQGRKLEISGLAGQPRQLVHPGEFLAHQGAGAREALAHGGVAEAQQFGDLLLPFVARIEGERRDELSDAGRR